MTNSAAPANNFAFVCVTLVRPFAQFQFRKSPSGQAIMSLMTLPPTSVSRKSRPLWR